MVSLEPAPCLSEILSVIYGWQNHSLRAPSNILLSPWMNLRFSKGTDSSRACWVDELVAGINYLYFFSLVVKPALLHLMKYLQEAAGTSFIHSLARYTSYFIFYSKSCLKELWNVYWWLGSEGLYWSADYKGTLSWKDRDIYQPSEDLSGLKLGVT